MKTTRIESGRLPNAAPPQLDLAKLTPNQGSRVHLEDLAWTPRLAPTETGARDAIHLFRELLARSVPTGGALVRHGAPVFPRFAAHLNLPTKFSPLEVRLRPPRNRTVSAQRSLEQRFVFQGRTVTQQRGPIEIEVPNAQRYINARTLKAMFGARPDDVLFRRVGTRWQICPDEYRVDLEGTDVFRLNEVVQIYS